MKKKANNDSGMSIPFGIGLGTLISLGIMLMGVFVITWLISNERALEESLGWGVMIVLILAAVTGSGASVYTVRHHILPVCIGTCLGFDLILFALTALFFDGQYQGVGVTTLVVLGSGIGVALIAIKYLHKPKSYRKKR